MITFLLSILSFSQLSQLIVNTVSTNLGQLSLLRGQAAPFSVSLTIYSLRCLVGEQLLKKNVKTTIIALLHFLNHVKKWFPSFKKFALHCKISGYLRMLILIGAGSWELL